MIIKGMVKLILATDMAKHKELTDQFQKCLNDFDFKNKEHLEIVKFPVTFNFKSQYFF